MSIGGSTADVGVGRGGGGRVGMCVAGVTWNLSRDHGSHSVNVTNKLKKNSGLR